jgi:site-specific DNA recombinase
MDSPEIQLISIREWASRNGYVIVAEIIDPDATGRNFNRDVQSAIEMVERGDADAICVYKFSRFGRDNAGFQVNLGRIVHAKGDLYSSTEDVDAQSAAGQLSRDMLAAIAAFESNRFSEQWKDAQDLRIGRGLPHTATPRFGYRHHKCRSQAVTTAGWRIRHEKDGACRTDGSCREEYRVDPVRGPVLADLFHRYLAGEGLATLAAWCNVTSQPRDRGGKWYPSTIGDLLDSGFGAGLLRVGVRGTKGRPDKDEKVSYLPGSQEPVIDEETWNRYLAKRRGLVGTPSSLKRSQWPLTGLIKCGLCGGSMTCASSDRGRGYIYRCSRMQNLKTCAGTWRTRAAIETAMFDELDAVADELAAAGREAARTVERSTADINTARTKAERELDEVKAAKKRLARQVVLGNLTDEDISEEMATLKQRAEMAQRDLTRTAVPPRPWSPPEIRSLREDWPRLEVAAAREIACRLIDEIVVYPEKRVVVRLNETLLQGHG